MTPLKIFIGFDQVEAVAWHTLTHSILSRATVPVSFIPVHTRNLQGIYTRPRDPKQSNEFSFTRFLVPYLADYQGWALFMDCDMLVRTDIKKLFDLVNTNENQTKAALVVKHEYTPRDDTKYLGTKQYPYPRKNWSSVVLWNCGHHANRILTPDYVNTAPALDLHRFTHIADSDLGELPVTWNWLVGEYALGYKGVRKSDVCNVHFTVGGPYFQEYQHVDFSEDWFSERYQMTYCLQRDLMEYRTSGK